MKAKVRIPFGEDEPITPYDPETLYKEIERAIGWIDAEDLSFDRKTDLRQSLKEATRLRDVLRIGLKCMERHVGRREEILREWPKERVPLTKWQKETFARIEREELERGARWLERERRRDADQA